VANSSGAYTTGVVNASSFTTTNLVGNSSGVFTTGVVNAASYSVGTTFTANATLVNAYALSVQTNTASIGSSVTVASNGNVGINTSTPGYFLDVAGNARFGNNIWLSYPSANTWRVTNLSGNFYINYNNTQDYMVVNPANGVNFSSNVSVVGTTNAAAIVATSLSTGSATLSSVITGGFGINAYNIGVISSGTVTPNPLNGNYQYYTSNGAHTLAAPTSDCAIDLLLTNGSGAGTLTVSGFTYSGTNYGDTLNTTSGNKFIFSIRRINGTATFVIKALQ
jgi:hypothetical protein